jgi:hypothetical protein
MEQHLQFPVVRQPRENSPDFGGNYVSDGTAVVVSPPLSPLSPIIVPGTPGTPLSPIIVPGTPGTPLSPIIVPPATPLSPIIVLGTPETPSLPRQNVVTETPRTPGTIPRQLLYPESPPRQEGGIGRHKYTFVSKRRKSKSKSRSKSKSNKHKVQKKKTRRNRLLRRIS